MEEANSETSNSKHVPAIVCLDASTASFFVSETNVSLSLDVGIPNDKFRFSVT